MVRWPEGAMVMMIRVVVRMRMMRMRMMRTRMM